MISKNIHEKLLNGVQTLLIDTKIDLPYYGEFNLYVNFENRESIGTCGVNVTARGMNFIYSKEFLDKLSQKEVNFILLHEDFHLLFDHPARTTSGVYNHALAHIILEDIPDSFVEIPKADDGKNMALFVPIEYNGKLIFEELYEWLKDEKEKRSKSDKKGSESEYGPYGKNPNKETPLDTWSLDKLFENLENGQGEYLDKHLENGVSEEMRNAIVKDVMDNLKSRGLSSGSVEKTLNKLIKKRKDYLKELKRNLSNFIFGTIKSKTIIKPNRRQIKGLKGNRKLKTKINVILDVSGSMHGLVEKVLNYVYRSDIEVNLIQADTKVNSVKKLKSGKKIEMVKLVGFGGTVLMPAINYVADNFNNCNTCILTDGYCDSLDLSRLKGRVLIISAGVKVPITKTNNKVKQMLINSELK
jgi:predicted metal-dependent peptidase